MTERNFIILISTVINIFLYYIARTLSEYKLIACIVFSVSHTLLFLLLVYIVLDLLFGDDK